MSKMMEVEEFEEYVKCLMSMSMSHLMGKMDRKTFVSNLGIMAGQMGMTIPKPPKPFRQGETCPNCVEWWACDCVTKRKEKKI